MESVFTYIDVILPLRLPQLYTYHVPPDWVSMVSEGTRVEVNFGKHKIYSALVRKVHKTKPAAYTPKTILSVLDEAPVVTDIQFRFWEWIAKYYACTVGEVMANALPSGLKLASETRLVLSPMFNQNYDQLSEKEYLVVEALSAQETLTIEEVRKILQIKTVNPIIQDLLNKKIIYILEELREKYKPKIQTFVCLAEPYLSNPDLLREVMDKLSRAPRQIEVLMAFLSLQNTTKHILRAALADYAKVDTSVVKTLAEKGVFSLYEMEISRIHKYEEEIQDGFAVSEEQQAALNKITQDFESKNVILLHGITGSGKTQIFIELMLKTIAEGKQVLYLLPEISLTAQIVIRLQRVFGDQIAVYHSRFSENERVELWKSILEGKSIILGARSALFAPFQRLGLIIIDEEHDPSYKQQELVPLYNARDAAIYMAQLYDAKVLLGTATPSLETYYNVLNNKYGLVNLYTRYGNIELPELHIVNLKEATKRKQMQSIFSTELLDALRTALKNGEQAILFQNRRGYSPILRCKTCDWTANCIHCDVSLTYHKLHHNLRCHYCSYEQVMPAACPACGGRDLHTQGFGTEKIEDELKIYLPEARILRMDFDTVKGKHGHHQIIEQFANKEVDILVGTQMVTKGLDFDNVSLVGVLNADQILHFPDFRATERAFQLITQVSGRAGRKYKQGKVLIQAYNVHHPVLKEIKEQDFKTFLDRELTERQEFHYPPYYRLIQLTLEHKVKDTVHKAAQFFVQELKKVLGERVIGPAEPSIGRIREYFILNIMIKLEKNPTAIHTAKEIILRTDIEMHSKKGMSGVRLTIDVDP